MADKVKFKYTNNVKQTDIHYVIVTTKPWNATLFPFQTQPLILFQRFTFNHDTILCWLYPKTIELIKSLESSGGELFKIQEKSDLLTLIAELC